MQDALISPEGIAILTGAGIVEAGEDDEAIYVHCTTELKLDSTSTISKGQVTLKASFNKGENPYNDTAKHVHDCYAMLKDPNGNIVSEPFSTRTTGAGKLTLTEATDSAVATLSSTASTPIQGLEKVTSLDNYTLFVDYYEKKESGAYQIDITPNSFGGYFYVEASTLFRDQSTGQDDPAEFIIPNAKVQSNFTFSMASSGDPSAFDFTLDAFPGRVKGTTTDVLAAIQVITSGRQTAEAGRVQTDANTKAAG